MKNKKPNPLSRRDFLKMSGVTTLGLALSACGLIQMPTATSTLIPSPTNTLIPTETPTATPTLTATPSPPTLSNLANDLGVYIGSQASYVHLRDFPEFKARFKAEFNLHEMDAEFNWDVPPDMKIWIPALHPTRDTFDFSQADLVVRQAKSMGKRARGQSLIWGNKAFTPSWLWDGNFSRAEALTILEEHVRTVVGRYNGSHPDLGSVHEWIVANESLATVYYWNSKFGSDFSWVRTAFVTAREADPNAKLIYNDTFFEFDGEPHNGEISRSNAKAHAVRVYNFVSNLIAEGTPIDAIGFQCHLDGDYFVGDRLEHMMNAFTKAINKYQGLGLEVYITELDVAMDKVSGTENEKQDTQAQIYQAIYETGLHSGVKSFSMFGENDRLSFYNGSGRPDAKATILDNNSKPKPAYFAIRQVLFDMLSPSQPIPTTGTPSAP